MYVGKGKNGMHCFSNCLPTCPDGWETFEGECYLWVTNQTKSWRDAEGFCKNEGGHLASVTSKRINKYMLGRVGQSKVWIGANDQKTEGKWEWSDNCNPWDFEDWIHRPTLQRKDSCAELYNRNENDQGWNDAECHKALNFVCARAICPGEPINKQLTPLVKVQAVKLPVSPLVPRAGKDLKTGATSSARRRRIGLRLKSIARNITDTLPRSPMRRFTNTYKVD